MNAAQWVRSHLLPPIADPWLRGQAGLVMVTCLGIGGAAWSLVLAWLISGDLEGETAVAALIFTLILGGLLALTRHRPVIALWLLVGLLLLLITLDVSSYGLGSPAAASFFLPVTLAACGLGLGAGLVVAGVSTAVIWLTAIAAALNWYTPYVVYEESHLTFTAPFLTVLIWVIALLVGYWIRFLHALVIVQEDPG